MTGIKETGFDRKTLATFLELDRSAKRSLEACADIVTFHRLLDEEEIEVKEGSERPGQLGVVDDLREFVRVSRTCLGEQGLIVPRWSQKYYPVQAYTTGGVQYIAIDWEHLQDSYAYPLRLQYMSRAIFRPVTGRDLGVSLELFEHDRAVSQSCDYRCITDAMAIAAKSLGVAVRLEEDKRRVLKIAPVSRAERLLEFGEKLTESDCLAEISAISYSIRERQKPAYAEIDTSLAARAYRAGEEARRKAVLKVLRPGYLTSVREWVKEELKRAGT